MNLQITPIAAPLPWPCPHCTAPVYISHATDSEVPGGGYWLDDGDTLGPLWDRLSPAQKQPSANDAELLVGHCPACGGAYQVLSLGFMVAEFDDAQPLLFGNESLGPELNECCAATPALAGVPVWVRTTHHTRLGVLHQHVLGPWAVAEEDEDELVGIAGVSCGGSATEDGPWGRATELALSLWDAARADVAAAQAAFSPGSSLPSPR